MRREGSNEDHLSPEDFLCDFCGQPWAETRQMVEGHRGSLICSECLTAAYTQVVRDGGGEHVPDVISCTLCLEHKDLPHWKGARENTWACQRCIKQSAAILQKDPDSGWKKPE